MPTESNTDIPAIPTVQEKILLAKQDYAKTDQTKGPTVDLFCHEIKDQNPKLRRFFDLFLGSTLFLIHLLIFPFIVIGIKLSGKKPVFKTVQGVGQFGTPLHSKIYNIGVEQRIDTGKQISSGPLNYFCRFLYISNIFKFPQLKHVLKGDMSLVGPELLTEDYSMHVVNSLTDFHKRFAPKPGIYTPVSYYKPLNSSVSPEYNLKKDLSYSCAQTSKKYFRTLFSKNKIQPNKPLRTSLSTV